MFIADLSNERNNIKICTFASKCLQFLTNNLVGLSLFYVTIGPNYRMCFLDFLFLFMFHPIKINIYVDLISIFLFNREECFHPPSCKVVAKREPLDNLICVYLDLYYVIYTFIYNMLIKTNKDNTIHQSKVRYKLEVSINCFLVFHALES